MKVKMTIELELPDVKDDNVKLGDEYVPGITWEKAYIIQDVFDNFVNYAICRHLRDACEWMGKHKDSPHSEAFVEHHNQWADILRAAEPSMKIELIK